MIFTLCCVSHVSIDLLQLSQHRQTTAPNIYTEWFMPLPAALEQLPSPQGTTASEAELPFRWGTPGTGFWNIISKGAG